MNTVAPFAAANVANRLLDIADLLRIDLSNLSLQKILFLAHGVYLTKYGEPLIKEHFEAWQYGPVLPSIYRQFKVSGHAPIKARVTLRDLRTGEEKLVEGVVSDSADDVLLAVLGSYGRKSARFLVDLTHVKKGPWQLTVDKSRTMGSLGLKISNETILESFRYLKVSVGKGSKDDLDEAYLENAPFAEYGFG